VLAGVVGGVIVSSARLILDATRRLTPRAHPVELVLVRAKAKAVLSGHLVLQLLDAGLLELYDVRALDAYQMVVVRGIVGKLVAREPVAEAPLVRHSALRQELEGPVNGGVPHARVARADLGEELLDAHMILGAKERVDDEPALIGRAKPFPVHVGPKHGSKVFELEGRSIDLPTHSAVLAGRAL